MYVQMQCTSVWFDSECGLTVAMKGDLNQLGKMRKYIDKWTSNIIYKQTIVPLFDYADFLIDSGPSYYQERITSLHEKAVMTIDGKVSNQDNIRDMEALYRLQHPRRKRKCPLSKGIQLWNRIPQAIQRSTSNVKFKIALRQLGNL